MVPYMNKCDLPMAHRPRGSFSTRRGTFAALIQSAYMELKTGTVIEQSVQPTLPGGWDLLADLTAGMSCCILHPVPPPVHDASPGTCHWEVPAAGCIPLGPLRSSSSWTTPSPAILLVRTVWNLAIHLWVVHRLGLKLHRGIWHVCQDEVDRGVAWPPRCSATGGRSPESPERACRGAGRMGKSSSPDCLRCPA